MEEENGGRGGNRVRGRQPTMSMMIRMPERGGREMFMANYKTKLTILSVG